MLRAEAVLCAVAVALLLGCSSPARVAQAPKTDPTSEEWYSQALEQLTAMSREASELARGGKHDEASAVITKAQPLATKLLLVPRPTLPAMEAASDLDQLYGEMLMRNRHYGWARLAFQKNVTRWKNWKPQTPETERRLKLAISGIAECDRRL